jgi:5-methylcytosine-specific restriction endonuclease McrA
MPIIRLCTVPTCGKERRAGSARCDEHAKAYERERSAYRRDDSHKSFYDRKKWRICARRIKFERPICERCDEAISQEVHHEPPLSELLAAGRNPFDPTVLVALCKPCHSAITLAEQRRAG